MRYVFALALFVTFGAAAAEPPIVNRTPVERLALAREVPGLLQAQSRA